MSLLDYVKHYDGHYAREGEKASGQLTWKPQYELWRKQGFKQGMTILDYGCGVGIMVEALKAPNKYLGVDISEKAIKLARKRYPEAHFEVSEMGKLRTGKKDWVVAQSVFTHVPKEFVLICLADIKQALIPKSIALIDVLIGEDKTNDDHVRHYTEDEWANYLKFAGLNGKKVADIEWVGFKHSFYRVVVP